jgi:hypothetical protein
LDRREVVARSLCKPSAKEQDSFPLHDRMLSGGAPLAHPSTQSPSRLLRYGRRCGSLRVLIPPDSLEYPVRRWFG